MGALGTLAIAGCVAAGALAPAGAAHADSGSAASDRQGRFEIKRQNTERGTPGESTNTMLRMERYFDGPVAMFRFDLPLPDEKTDFAGDPFAPRPGDIKMRLRFRSMKSGERSFPAFVEASFPTADPQTLGKGKYQLSAGIRMVDPVRLPFLDASSHRSTFEVELQQTNSVAGDSNATDINNSKLEFTLFDTWRQRYTTKLKLKPSFDWVLNGRSGAVAELEAGLNVDRNWRTWLMFGHRAWGPSGIANTYQTRIELGVNYTY